VQTLCAVAQTLHTAAECKYTQDFFHQLPTKQQKGRVSGKDKQGADRKRYKRKEGFIAWKC